MINKLTVFRFVFSVVLITALAGGTVYASTLRTKPPVAVEVVVEQPASLASSLPAKAEQVKQAQPVGQQTQAGQSVVDQTSPTASDQPVASSASDQVPAKSPQVSGDFQISGVAGTNFQQSLQAAIAQRKASGQPVPSSISFEYDIVDQGGSQQSDPTNGQAANILVTSKTVVTLMHPAQGGYDKWPELVVEAEDLDGAEGFVKPGNYDQAVRDWLAGKLPGIWDQYEFGYEPRQYTFEETYAVNYSEAEFNDLITALSDVSNVSSVEEILLGFTYEGPAIDYKIEQKFETCLIACVTWAEFGAQFKLDWGLGLRLPMEVTLDSPDPVDEGVAFNPTTSIKGLNWSDVQYAAAGVPAEGGNEFVMRFEIFLGGSIKIVGEEILGAAIQYTVAESKSFITPFGPGASFPIPTLDVPIWAPDLVVADFSFGFGFKPNIGSDKVTADWGASLDSSGSGTVTYSNSAVPVTFGPVNPTNGPGQAKLQLENYRYWFTKFLMEISAYIDFDVFGFDAARIDIPITDFDLSFIPGILGLYVKEHAGTSDTVALSVAIQDLPAVVTAGSDQTADEGDLVSLAPAATFTDPGINDMHIASIDWGDGSPVEVGTLVEAAGAGTVSGSHVYADDGVYTVLINVCEGLSCGSDSLTVTIENLAPSVSAITAPLEKLVGTLVTANASFTDLGVLDTHTAEWDWGDGALEPGIVTQGAGSGTVEGSHMYTACQVFSIVLTVTDDDGGFGTSPAYSILILSPKDGLPRLIDMVKALGLDNGIENSLLSKLENALEKMDDGKYKPAENMLGAFINELEAQRGKKIAEADADALILYAQDIIAASEAGLCTGP